MDPRARLLGAGAGASGHRFSGALKRLDELTSLNRVRRRTAGVATAANVTARQRMASVANRDNAPAARDIIASVDLVQAAGGTQMSISLNPTPTPKPN